jgi:hypothetical protein
VIHSQLRPVFITCAIKAASTAIVRIGMRNNGMVSGRAQQ